MSFFVVVHCLGLSIPALAGVNGADCHAAKEAEYRNELSRLLELEAKGDICADASLGRIYVFGISKIVQPDEAKAFHYLIKAAEAGLTDAQIELAALYMRRPHDSDSNNAAQAIRWMAAAANAGNTEAQTSLGKMYLLGYNAPRDLQKGFYWLLRADKEGGIVAHQILDQFASQLVRDSVPLR